MEEKLERKNVAISLFVCLFLSSLTLIFIVYPLCMTTRVFLAQFWFSLGVTQKSEGRVLAFKDYVHVSGGDTPVSGLEYPRTRITIEFITQNGLQVTNDCHATRNVAEKYRTRGDSDVKIEYARYWPYWGRLLDAEIYFNSTNGFRGGQFLFANAVMALLGLVFLSNAIWIQVRYKYYRRFSRFVIVALAIVLTPSVLFSLAVSLNGSFSSLLDLSAGFLAKF